MQINSNIFEKGDNEHIDNVDWNVGVSKDIVLKDGSYILIDIKEVLSPTLKELHETRGKVISDYQNALEKEWLSQLKSKYSVKINMELLESLIEL